MSGDWVYEDNPILNDYMMYVEEGQVTVWL